MDATQVINDYLENPAMDFDFEDFQAMAEDYKFQQLMSELQDL